MSTRISTYKACVDNLKDVALSHMAVKQSQVGELSDLDIQNNIHPFQRFPVVHFIPRTSSMDRFGKVTFSFTMIVADIAENEEDLQRNTHNNTFMIIQDLISKYVLTTWTSVDMELLTPVPITPFVERYNNNLAGWSAEIDVIVKSSLDLCNAAFE
jgi:hypothetical protein